MGADEGLQLADELVFGAFGRHLSDLEREIFLRAWTGLTYKDIAESLRYGRYTEQYVREQGANLFSLLSQALAESVTKTNFRAALERYAQSRQRNGAPPLSPALPAVTDGSEPDDPNFVGRSSAIADLNHLVQQGARVILIQGEGGQGKTTLARKYLEMQRFSVCLDLWMATETQNVTPVESVVEEWLRRDFNEEPGREFGINLERLKRKLRNESQRIGVLIDNLESALDRHGKVIEPHRRYVDLLRILADPTVRSITLITSREQVYESSVGLERYELEGLDEQAWREFFQKRGLNAAAAAIAPMTQAYGGNAKAMKILSGVIRKDFDGDVDGYWRENSHDLLYERELRDLVASQFDRLQNMDPQAYCLLCRLGCYRYQEVNHVSIEGVASLLWDVPDAQRRAVIRALHDRSLMEVRMGPGKYWLHPVIRTEAIARLRHSQEWETINRKAAEFWLNSVPVVTTIDDALKGLEAYHHYMESGDFELAADVIVEVRNNKWGESLPLGWFFYRLGLLQQMIAAITGVIHHLQPDYRLGRLYNLLGYIYRFSGQIQASLTCHQEAAQIAESFGHERLKISTLFDIGLCQKDLGKFELAIDIFDQICSLPSAIAQQHIEYVVYSRSCLAYLNSLLGFENNARQLIEQVEQAIDLPELTSWGKGYSLLLVSSTYRNLGNINKAFELYAVTIQISEENPNTHIRAKAINGIAQLYREQQNFEQALTTHFQALEILERLGAKTDLADAYYQIGLTYKRMGQIENSQTNFQEAIRLYHGMAAIEQIARVQRALSDEKTSDC